MTPSLQTKGRLLNRAHAGVGNHVPSRDSAPRYAAIMEPSGCNRWQPVANARARKTAQTSHGKAGVDGSSPSEGSAKAQLTGLFRSSLLASSPCYAGYGAVYGAVYGAFRCRRARIWRLVERYSVVAVRGANSA